MIRTSHEGAIGFLTLARPEVRNALTPQMLRDLAESAVRLGASCEVLVLCGEGRAFCAGFDLNLCRDDGSGDVLRAMLEGLSAAIDALRSQPAPVVAVVQGAAVAGGCALLGGADLVLASAEARLGYPVTRLGISPAVSSPFLAREVEGWGSRSLLLDPGLIDAHGAMRLGLVSEVLGDPGAARERGVEVAQALAGKGRAAVRATRAWLHELSGPRGPEIGRGLGVSEGLVGGEEQIRLLPRAWADRGS